MYKERIELYKSIEEKLKTKLLVYVTSDRQGFETQIAQDVIDIFIEQLDKIGVVSKISLYLYTRGGDTAAAWNIVNLIRQYCDNFEVIIPHKAHSGGTLISIGANSIIMTKQATLGPIDPSINTPLNPQIPTIPGQTMPVSVEAVKGYLAFAKEELGIKDEMALSNIMLKLSDSVHPLVLGHVYRSRAQIKMLAEKLLVNQINDKDKMQQIISFLCSDSGSHDYTINRREAKNHLGLNVIKPDEELYTLIKKVYDDIAGDFLFNEPFNPKSVIEGDKQGRDEVNLALVESIEGGSDVLINRMAFRVVNNGGGQRFLNTELEYRGWKHEDL